MKISKIFNTSCIISSIIHIHTQYVAHSWRKYWLCLCYRCRIMKSNDGLKSWVHRKRKSSVRENLNIFAIEMWGKWSFAWMTTLLCNNITKEFKKSIVIIEQITTQHGRYIQTVSLLFLLIPVRLKSKKMMQNWKSFECFTVAHTACDGKYFDMKCFLCICYSNKLKTSQPRAIPSTFRVFTVA